MRKRRRRGGGGEGKEGGEEEGNINHRSTARQFILVVRFSQRQSRIPAFWDVILRHWVSSS
jgi:hypothetical protein